MWELLFKIALTIVVVIPAGFALRGIWTHQLDPEATISRIFQSASEPGWLATRDPMKLYQGGQPIADIAGKISEDGPRVVFRQLVDAGSLDASQLVEWKRLKLRVVRVGESISLSGGGGGGVLKDVRKDVECQIIR